ncbi:MerR family transcriptional regulator [Paracoccus luteus]|uniref:MerR family transcriptional regulator n=1 Tax=Paracoccus luteus TaxID=2508543 RepID=UPI00106F541C|nr:MerR family DNA-binding transcriptional regulator [Paracoccus luteus]
MTDELLTIRQMCDRYGVTPRALRFYESREMLFPERRGQHRLYDRRDRGRLVLILRGKRFGFSLEEIRQLLDLYVPGAQNRDQIARTLATARGHLDHMRRQHDELALAITDLQSHIDEAQARLDALPPAATPIR